MKKSGFLTIPLLSLTLLIGTAYLAVSPATAVKSGTTAKEDLTTFANSLVVGQRVVHKNLVIYPILLSKVVDGTSYVTLDEALESGKVKITEVGDGSVPTLRLEVMTTEPLFFMAGEVVTGAKQDRILQSDLMFKGKRGVFEIPVYCVEAGRWTHESDRFGAGKTLGSKKVRKAAAMKEGQTIVWDNVRKQNEDVSAVTGTSKFQASYESEKYKNDSSEYLDALLNLPSKHNGRMVGVVIAVAGKPASADVFANPHMFKKLWSKVLKAGVMDAITAPDGTLNDNTAARVFLGKALTGVLKRQENPSMGEEYSIHSADVQGNFFSASNAVLHLALFTDDPKRPDEDRPIPLRQQQQRENFPLNR